MPTGGSGAHLRAGDRKRIAVLPNRRQHDRPGLFQRGRGVREGQAVLRNRLIARAPHECPMSSSRGGGRSVTEGFKEGNRASHAPC